MLSEIPWKRLSFSQRPLRMWTGTATDSVININQLWGPRPSIPCVLLAGKPGGLVSCEAVCLGKYVNVWITPEKSNRINKRKVDTQLHMPPADMIFSTLGTSCNVFAVRHLRTTLETTYRSGRFSRWSWYQRMPVSAKLTVSLHFHQVRCAYLA